MRVGIRHVEEICVGNFSCFLLTSWSIVYLAKGVISVIGWWSIQAFSIVSLFILIGVTLLIVWKGIFRQRIDGALLFIVIFSIIGAWPLGWFANIGRLAYRQMYILRALK